MAAETWTETALRWLLPAACVHCREDLPPGERGPLGPECVERLPPPPEPPPPSGPFCRLIRAAARHSGPAASLVHALKFRGLPAAAAQAGALMARELARCPELWAWDALVPVPAHPSRERRRGYDQALLIARALGDAAGLPVLRLLERRRRGAPSWTLGRADRRAQIRGAFGPAPWSAGLAQGRRLLVIDDVCATGETLEDCARVLLEQGARDAAGYAFARSGLT